jgi:hypothetical protein
MTPFIVCLLQLHLIPFDKMVNTDLRVLKEPIYISEENQKSLCTLLINEKSYIEMIQSIFPAKPD